MRPKVWFDLLREGGFAVDPSRLPLLVGVSAAGPFNSLMSGVQSIVSRGDLAGAELHGPPVFIIGHWRSGTTLLHELLVRDVRFGSPSTYQCFAPHHFLLTEWAFRRFGKWLLPGRRPMDNMAAGWERPQEDEFALMNLGMPSPYRRIAFPRRGGVDLDYLDFEGVSTEERQKWFETLQRFLLSVSVATGRPLIVKSPTHTGRVGWLAKQFPDAKFIHISRDPRELFPSTKKLWSSLDQIQALQTSDDSELDEYVLQCLERMYRSFHRDRDVLGPGRLIDVRYEDLAARPVETIESIYHQLHLADFDSVRGDLEAWEQQDHRQYSPNRHTLDSQTESVLKERWSEYFERYDY